MEDKDMLYKVKGNGIACKVGKVGKTTKSLYHIIWGGYSLNDSFRPCKSFPCHTLKDFKASIEIYVRTFIYEEY